MGRSAAWCVTTSHPPWAQVHVDTSFCGSSWRKKRAAHLKCSLHTLQRRVKPVTYTPFGAKPTDKQANSMTIYINMRANTESRSWTSLKPEGREKERETTHVYKRRDRDLAWCRTSLWGKSVRGFWGVIDQYATLNPVWVPTAETDRFSHTTSRGEPRASHGTHQTQRPISCAIYRQPEWPAATRHKST